MGPVCSFGIRCFIIMSIAFGSLSVYLLPGLVTFVVSRLVVAMTWFMTLSQDVKVAYEQAEMQTISDWRSGFEL